MKTYLGLALYNYNHLNQGTFLNLLTLIICSIRDTYSQIYAILISFMSAPANCYFSNSNEKCQYWLIQFLLALIHSHCSIWLSLTVDTTAYLHIHSITKKFNKKAWCTLLNPHSHPNYGLYLPLWANTPHPLTTATVAQSITPLPPEDVGSWKDQNCHVADKCTNITFTANIL